MFIKKFKIDKIYKMNFVYKQSIPTNEILIIFENTLILNMNNK